MTGLARTPYSPSRRGFLRDASLAGISLTALAPILTACGGSSSGSGGPTGLIRWGIPQEPDTLDAQATALSASWTILQYLGNSLVHRDMNDANTAGLASKWTVSENGEVIEFKLREGATFHDGEPFDASALAYTFERGLAKATKSPIFPSQVGDVKRTEVVDATTFRIYLSQPYGPLIDNFGASGGSWLQPLSKTAVDRWGKDYGRHPVGTGPWKLAEWRAGDRLLFNSNSTFKFGNAGSGTAGPPRIPKLQMMVSPEDSSRVAALQAGELEIAPIPASSLGSLSGRNDITVLRKLRKGMGLTIHFNFKVKPFDDVRVRQAMHLALDRAAIIKVAVSGQGIPAYGPLPPGFPYYWSGVEKIGYGYDPQKAAQLLDAAGWRMGSNGVRVKDGKPFQFTILTIANSSENTRAAQLIREQYKQVGIDLTLRTEDIAAINPKLFAHDFELSFMFWSDQDPDILYREFDSSQINDGVNWGSYSNSELDGYLRAGRRAAGPAARAAAYAKAQKLMVEQAVWLPIYAVYDLTAVRTRLSGAVMHPDGYLLLNNATLKA